MGHNNFKENVKHVYVQHYYVTMHKLLNANNVHHSNTHPPFGPEHTLRGNN